MVNAHDVAAAIIERQHAADRTIDKMQLQKLLYLVQGAHIELWSEPAFRDGFQAYPRGPVVAGVEKTYRDAFGHGWEPIPNPVGGHPERLEARTVEIVSMVLDRFGSRSAVTLEALTKADGSPWSVARGDLAADASSQAVLDPAAIERWFGAHGIDESAELSAESRELFNRAANGDQDALAAFMQ